MMYIEKVGFESSFVCESVYADVVRVYTVVKKIICCLQLVHVQGHVQEKKVLFGILLDILMYQLNNENNAKNETNNK